MTIRQILKKYPKIEIELLLAHLLKKPKEFLYLNGGYRLTRMQANRLFRMVYRRQKGEPIAYILGYKDFYGLRFKVNRDVLIPRPETEWLVEKIVESDKWKVTSGAVKILDVGTGSGCIIISLAKALSARGTLAQRKSSPCARFYASDVSKKALAVARQNTGIHKAKIKFIHSDIFENVRMSFDVIVANLPYVPKKNYELRIKNLEWEPKNALVDPVKDFDIYESFFRQLSESQNLSPQSKIYLEIDPLARKKISSWTKKYLPGWQVKYYKDFNNFWRYAVIES